MPGTAGRRGQALSAQLGPIADALASIAQDLATHLPADSPQAQRARQQRPDAADLAAALDQADRLAAAVAAAAAAAPADDPLARDIGRVSAIAYAAVRAAAAGGPDQTSLAPRLTVTALRPLAQVLAAEPRPVAEKTAAEAGQQAGAAGSADDLIWQAATTATELLVTLGPPGPPGLAEAAAGLQALAVERAAEPAAAAGRFRELMAGLPTAIRVAPDGPYLVTNAQLRDHLGAPVPAPPQLALPQLALCRCGGSARKPFCDGSHVSNGFTGAKDPKRVPDRRDSYPGQQVTILDNRGLCQHSGLCTDRLGTVFRTSQEPFVAASGGRLDEIIRAVRDCPSGALGLAIDGQEQPTLRDWSGTREPAIEITQDGPYRVTGGISLASGDGREIPRDLGASAEHYALCRCGHSQNKPFCSGMHWYVNFRDPAPPAEPTLFEWAGGLPALTRMTRLLYEKHIPADGLLAAAFAPMPPGHPVPEARALAEAFGGPAAGPPPDLPPTELTGEQRARWAALAAQAARDAGLPADAAFQAALSSYLDWASRTAAGAPGVLSGARSGPGQASPGQASPGRPAVRWDWTAAGPPASPPDAAEQSSPEQPTPEVPVPGPGEPVSFAAHIRPLFRESDRKSMSFAFDLWSADDVRAHAAEILDRLRDGSMPCDGGWPPERIAVFQRWAVSGTQP